MVRILGLDPSLSSTGWGIIEVENNRMRYVADGFIPTDTKLPLPERWKTSLSFTSRTKLRLNRFF